MTSKFVVVGVDGSAASLNAIREAASYAQMMDAELRCVTSWNFVGYEDITGVFDPEQNARDIGRDAAIAVFGKDIPTRVSFVIRLGPAGDALVAESAHANLLVVGTRGHSAVGGFFLGSVSTHCAERAHCPVLVVPNEVETTVDAPHESADRVVAA
jgi:nucleotide-binding universal stress UspA family protein